MKNVKNVPLHNFSKKLKIACVVNNENLKIDRKIKNFCKFLENFDFDVKYDFSFECENYDLICLTNEDDVLNFEKTKVPIVLSKFDDKNLKYESKFKSICVFNEEEKRKIKKSVLVPFSTDAESYGYYRSVHKRDYKILIFADQQCEEKDSLINIFNLEKVEYFQYTHDELYKFTNEEMNLLYNDCFAVVCFEDSFKDDIINSVSCGVIPVVAFDLPVRNYMKTEKIARNCADKINYLKFDMQKICEMSKTNVKEMIPHHEKFISQNWGEFLQNSLIKIKGLNFI
jgi:hypothetical protein